MEEIQKKLGLLNYPRANAPAQSLLFAGMERYALLEWLFFKYFSFFSDFESICSFDLRLPENAGNSPNFNITLRIGVCWFGFHNGEV